MKQREKRYTGLILFLTTLVVCGMTVSCEFDNIEKAEYSYLVMAAGDINKDNVRFEDKGTEIRMLMFDMNSGVCVYNSLLAFPGNDLQQNSNPVECELGTYDILFIANETSYPGFTAQISAVGNITQLSGSYFKQISYEPTFQPTATKGFLMSAYYRNVVVVGGHTLTNPQIISVELLRSMAKVEVIFKNSDMAVLTTKRLTEIYLENVPDKYTLPANSDVYNYTSFPLIISRKETGSLSNPIFGEPQYQLENIGRVIFYTPEFLRSSTDGASQNTSLVLKGRSIAGEFKIVIDHQAFESNSGPRGTFNSINYSNLSIVRGTHYQITVNLTPLAGPIQVQTKVLPWEVNKSEIEFNKLVFSHSVYVGSTNVTATNLTGKNISLHTGEVAEFRFTLSSPTGALWKATLTNGLHFRFTPASVTEGIAGTEYRFYVEPTSAWTGTVNSTEIYISVEGEEAELIGAGYHGPSQRYNIRQIE